MSLEIEHKYIVVSDAYKSDVISVTNIEQGYLSRTPERTVRVRIVGEKGYLTIKGKNVGDTRLEFEYEIPVSDACEMLSLCDGCVIKKTRYIVNYAGFRWEVDEFHGDLAPLVLAEIELTDSSQDYPLPTFVGEDVTNNPMYYNSNLT